MKAVIDLGTNTFHLLIASPTDYGSNTSFVNKKIEPVYRERRFVKLAEDGIQSIGPAAFQRGLDAMIAFSEQLKIHGVSQYRAIGTAALRRAENGSEFIAAVKIQSGLQITLIDGQEEARLIAKGVQLTLPKLGNMPALIMDIGGGSVEFILHHNNQTKYAQSFPVGVAVLRNTFHQQEPIPTESLQQLYDFLKTQLAPLQQQLDKFPSIHLVGAAGIFEVLNNCLPTKEHSENLLASTIELDQLSDYYQRVLVSSFHERLAMNDVPNDRADMMVVALVLIQFILQISKAQRLTASAYALKEGVLSEMAKTTSC